MSGESLMTEFKAELFGPCMPMLCSAGNGPL